MSTPSFSRPLLRLLGLSLFAVGFAHSAHALAPTTLSFPAAISYNGTYIDSFDGLLPDVTTVTLTSATTFTASGASGTYSYTKTGANTGLLTYTSFYVGEGESETENGSVAFTFTSESAGTYTSSGTYSGIYEGDPYSGSFSDGVGSFTYTPITPAPVVSFVNKTANYVQTTAASPALHSYRFHSALEGLIAPYVTDPTLQRPGGGTLTYVYDGEDGRYNLETTFTPPGTAKPQLDAAFPNGNYTLNIGANNLVLTLSPDSYPAIPAVTTSAGQWINGQLVLSAAEAAAGFTLTSSATNANGHRTLEIYDDADEIDYFETDNEDGSTGLAPMSRFIPGGLLPVGGPYFVRFEYDAVVDVDATQLDKFGAGFAMFSTATEFEIVVTSASTPDPRDLVGTWTIATEGGGRAYITFLDNGTYHHSETGTADGNGHPGLEVGTYTWDAATGVFTAAPTVDQNGEWGLSHNGSSIILQVFGDELRFNEDGDVFTLDRVNPSPASAIVGTWIFYTEGRYALVTFLPDGSYRHTEAGAPVGDGFTGLEVGSYTWNPTTGALTAAPTLDQNGEWGLSHPLAPWTISVAGDQLTFLEGTEAFVANRADPITGFASFLADESIPYEQRGPSDDPDGDGIGNLLEYVLGGDPATPSPAALPLATATPDPETADTHLVLTLRLNASATDVLVTPVVSGDMVNWSSGSEFIETLSDTSADGVRTWVVRDRTPIDPSAPRRFFRVEAAVPQVP